MFQWLTKLLKTPDAAPITFDSTPYRSPPRHPVVKPTPAVQVATEPTLLYPIAEKPVVVPQSAFPDYYISGQWAPSHNASGNALFVTGAIPRSIAVTGFAYVPSVKTK